MTGDSIAFLSIMHIKTFFFLNGKNASDKVSTAPENLQKVREKIYS